MVNLVMMIEGRGCIVKNNVDIGFVICEKELLLPVMLKKI